MPKPKRVEAAAAYHRLAVDRYSRIIAEYLTYTFMGNTRDITLTPTIKRKKIAKKKENMMNHHILFLSYLKLTILKHIKLTYKNY